MADSNSVTSALATLGGSGWTPTNDPRYGGAIASMIPCTWANRPTTGLTNGQLIFVSDVGEGGAVFTWSAASSRWRALNGMASLKALGSPTGNIANTETIVLQALLPAGSWQTNDVLRVRDLSISKSGTTDTANLTIRIGTLGTTGDAAVSGATALAVLSAANQSYGGEFDIKLVSATSALKLGNAGTSAPFVGGGSSSASAATAITSAAANALFLSVAIASSGATNTVQAQSGQILLVTP